MNTQHANDTGTPTPGTANPITQAGNTDPEYKVKAQLPEEHPSDISHLIKAQGLPDLLGLMATPGGTPPG